MCVSRNMLHKEATRGQKATSRLSAESEARCSLWSTYLSKWYIKWAGVDHVLIRLLLTVQLRDLCLQIAFIIPFRGTIPFDDERIHRWSWKCNQKLAQQLTLNSSWNSGMKSRGMPLIVGLSGDGRTRKEVPVAVGDRRSAEGQLWQQLYSRRGFFQSNFTNFWS